MLDDRFWAKVDVKGPDDCWLWTANKNNKGYGLFRPGGLAPKRLSHRLSFSDAFGPIPDGMHVLHSCDTPACVNPAHLRSGTHRENMEDIYLHGRRNRSTRKKRAPDIHVNKMTQESVIALRRAYVAGDALEDIAQRFGCKLSALADYTGGRSWPSALSVDGSPSLEDLKVEGARRRRNGAKITYEIAEAIRARLAAGDTGRKVAKDFGIHFATVSDIKARKIWP